MQALDLCNNAIDLVGQGTHITSLDEQSREADACKRLLPQVLLRAQDKHPWSFCRKSITITADDKVQASLPPYTNTFSLPDDFVSALYILPQGSTTLSVLNYEQDLRFDYRVHENQKVLITEASAPFSLQYQAVIEDYDLMPSTFIEALELLLASRLAANFVKSEQGVAIAKELDNRGMELLSQLAQGDLMPELPVDEVTADILALAGKGLDNISLLEKRNAVDYCARKFPAILQRCLENYNWSFARKSIEISSKDQVEIDNQPLTYTYRLPADVDKLLFITTTADESGANNYIVDQKFDFRVTGDERYLITETKPPFMLQYQALLTDVNLFPQAFIDAVEHLVAADLAGNFTARTSQGQAVQTAQDSEMLYKRASDIIAALQAQDLPIELPISSRCERVANLLGISIANQPLVEQRHFADRCEAVYELTLQRCLENYNWSFARKDEVITDDYLIVTDDGQEIVSLPWKHSYRIPEDVARILCLTPMTVDSWSERISAPAQIRFNFRNYDGEKILVTDAVTPFIMQYQAKGVDEGLMPPLFIQAVEYLSAAELAPNFTDTAKGINGQINYRQQALMFLDQAAALDAQQGAYSIKRKRVPAFLRARR